MHIKAISL